MVTADFIKVSRPTGKDIETNFQVVKRRVQEEIGRLQNKLEDGAEEDESAKIVKQFKEVHEEMQGIARAE